MCIYIYIITLILIASIVLICKSLWIKASAKWLNVMYIVFCSDQHSSVVLINSVNPLFDMEFCWLLDRKLEQLHRFSHWDGLCAAWEMSLDFCNPMRSCALRWAPERSCCSYRGGNELHMMLDWICEAQIQISAANSAPRVAKLKKLNTSLHKRQPRSHQ